MLFKNVVNFLLYVLLSDGDTPARRCRQVPCFAQPKQPCVSHTMFCATRAPRRHSSHPEGMFCATRRTGARQPRLDFGQSILGHLGFAQWAKIQAPPSAATLGSARDGGPRPIRNVPDGARQGQAGDTE